MNLLTAVQHHGYAVTTLCIFIAACGLPLPISIVLLIAGAFAHGGTLNLSLLVLVGAASGLLGDTLMYLGGRYTGWWLLSFLCRISINPEACIFGSANSFYRRGPKTLLFSKFVPGLATVAAPLAGSLNMSAGRFLRLAAAGQLFYVVTWTSVGFLFAPFLKVIIAWVQRVGHFTAATVGVLILLYVLWLVISSLRDTRFSTVERIAAEALHEQLREAVTHDRVVVIADVRSHGYYDPGTQRIKNSIRVEPSRLREELSALREFMVPECEIYLYCSCAREATSVRVAKMLEQENCRTKVIQGGLKAWIKAGGPLEPVPAGDVEHLPSFDR